MSARALLVVLFFLALGAQAEGLININTADKATLMTLPGIGEVKAQAIIDYRATTPFINTEDIMNVSGIGTATYNGIKDLITVSLAAPTQTQSQSQTSTTTEIQTQPQPAVAGATPVPALRAVIFSQPTVVAAAGSWFEGEAYGSAGEPLHSNVRYVWNFGDGATGEGRSVFHTYAYPGSYMVVLTVSYNYSSGTSRLNIQAQAPQVVLQAEGDGSLTLINRGKAEVEVGGWSLRGGEKTFLIPEETYVVAGGGVRFASAVLGFLGDRNSKLHYPNGTEVGKTAVAATSPERGVQIAPGELAPKKSSSLPYRTSVMSESLSGQTFADQVLPAAEASEGKVLGASDKRAEGGSYLWWSLAGLVVVVAVGSMGTQYVLRQRETRALADEFEIEQ